MIWFACKQCGKRLRQPDSAVGSFVFCDCGAGNRVPWESTLPTPVEAPPDRPAEETPEAEEERLPRRWSERVEIDPGYCLNHPDVPSELACDDCGEHFCPACTVVVRGKTLCGPCKNYRVARLQRPPSVSGMAIVALILAILGGPVSFCLSTYGRVTEIGAAPITIAFGIGALLLPTVALLLAFLALGKIERNPTVGGRGMALTGATTAVIGVVWSLTMLVVLVGKPFVE
jgi:hypothetical protein